MRLERNRNLSIVVMSLVCGVFLAGCSVHTSKSGDDKNKHEDTEVRSPLGSVSVHEKGDGKGKNDDVEIRSPFGSISVHAGNVDVKDVGLPVYPGARPTENRDDDHDSDNANVNISSSLFGLKVVVQKFDTDDSPDKVLDFYQKPMGKYGKVIQCSGEYHNHYHHRGKNAPVSCDDNGSGSEKELKVGTEDDQHVVAVKPHGKGSEFTLVYVRAKEGDSKDTI